MLIVPIYINQDKKDELRIHNIGGDLDGVCRYRIYSDHLGDLGMVEHDRRQGMYKLIQKVTELAYNQSTLDGEGNDW